MNALAQSFILYARALVSQRASQERDRLTAARTATKKAAALAKAQREHDEAISEYMRLNYYQDVEQANYDAAREAARKLPPPTPLVNPRDYDMADPTPAQWATLTDAQKADKGSVRF